MITRIEKCTCDRCGKDIEEIGGSHIIKVKHIDYCVEKLTNEWNGLDFCEDCKKSFAKWLKGKESEEE